MVDVDISDVCSEKTRTLGVPKKNCYLLYQTFFQTNSFFYHVMI